jgi:hypothetical protein
MQIKQIFTIVFLFILALLSKQYTGFGADYMIGYLVYIAASMFWKVSKSELIIGVLSFALFIELSQLIKTPFFETIRATTIGNIIIGGTFDPVDIIVYIIGIILGSVISSYLHKPTK